MRTILTRKRDTTAQASSEATRRAGRRHRARGALARLPAAAWICAAIALANALTFSLIVPAFQVPDEPEHYAYTEYLVHTGDLPHAPAPATEYSPEEQAALEGLYFPQLLGSTGFGRPPWNEEAAASVKALIAASPSRISSGGVTGESDNPPLYYALEAVPYEIASGGSFFDRLEAMRILSALLFAVTVLGVFCFVSEALRGPRWMPTAAALAVALQPQVAFIGGGVNNDNLMFAAAAALLWLLARCFRRGLTMRRGAAIGLVVAVGLLTKVTFIGLLPGVAIGLALLAFSQRRRTSAIRPVLAAIVVAGIPVAAYVILNATLWHRSLLGGALGPGSVVSGASSAAGAPATGNFREFLSYIWQFYLPRLPGMRAQFSFYPLWHVWFKGFIGDFGLLDYGFPNWVYVFAGVIFLGLAALALRALIGARSAVRARWPEIVSYLAIVVGLLLAIARAGFPYQLQTHYVFEQARYVFPLLGLYGLFLALAMRGAGRRWGPAIACLIVVATLGQDLFAQLLTLQRYWT